MNSVACVMLAALSVFDYPARQARHDELRGQFISAVADGDAEAMESTCREGVALLPEDPTWKYNLACSLSRAGKKAEALDALERAIRLGFRDTVAIGNDKDLRPIAGDRRFEDLLALAERLAGKPALFGPMSSIPADGQAGSTIIVGEQNLSWNLDAKCFIAKLAMDGADGPGNAGDIYLNRDGGHSVLKTDEFPGLTKVSLARECREHHIDMGMPNMLFPCPVFGNCSLAIVGGPMWRSMPRALMTTESGRLGLMQRLYLSNQVWVFPAVYDIAPVGTNGDVFASVAPFWISTQGRSWSDLYYLKAALEVSRSLKPDVKRRIVSQGLLAPTVQTILRKSLKGVANEDDYLTPKAHPTAFPQKGLDLARLKSMSAALTEDGKRFCYPLCRSKTEMDAYLPGAWQTGAFGIKEPDPARSEWVPPEGIDLVLCPCAGFDGAGNRVGMGAGYYDRYLPQCKNAAIYAVAFEAQRLTQVYTDEHDRKMDGVITEK